MKQTNYTGRNSLPGDLAVWDGHVATVVGKLLMGFPQTAASSNPAGGTTSKTGSDQRIRADSTALPAGLNNLPTIRRLR